MNTDGPFGAFIALASAAINRDENKLRALIDAGADVNMTELIGQSALLYAVEQSNNESVVRALIDAGADVNITDDGGQTALFYAVQQSNNENVVRALIDAGADVNMTDHGGRTALFGAVRQSNNESVVRALIDAGADVNMTDHGGRTALFYAVQQSNNESVVRALIDGGADVNRTDDYGLTALLYAIREFYTLIDAGADVNKTDDGSRTALLYAFRGVYTLIDAGAYVNKTDDGGRTALLYAIKQSNNESVVRALIDAGADVNRTDNRGRPALLYAIKQSNNESVVRALIDAGADVKKTDDGGRTALSYAVEQSKDESVVRALIDAGANVNRTDDGGRSALFYAVQQSNNERVVRALINAGADINITDDGGQTALFYAVRVVYTLIDAGADVKKTDDGGRTALFYAVQQSNNESVVRALINAGADVNITDDGGQTALFYAVRVVYALSVAGADVNRTYDGGRTALFYAVKQSINESVVHALIDAGADVNRTDISGRTALFDCVTQSNNENVVRALIDAGTDVNLTDNYGKTALLYAVQQSNGYGSLFRASMDAGADVNRTNDGGRIALFYASRKSNNERVVHTLIDAGADVNRTDDVGRSALFYAFIQSNNERVVHTLIDAGAEVNRTDDVGHTALFYAVQQSNNESLVHSLIAAGADVNLTDDYGKTALFYAVQQSNNESVVHALIDAGAVNITDDYGRTALFSAVQQSNNESVVHAFIDAGADVNIIDDYGQTALFYAVYQSNNESVVHALIDAGCALDARDVYGRTPLFYALKYPKSAHILVEKGGKRLFRSRDNFQCSVLNFFVDHDLLNTEISSDFFELLEEGGVQRRTFVESILNMAFCKFPQIVLASSTLWSYPADPRSYITGALGIAKQYIDSPNEIKRLIGLINEKCQNGEGISEALELLAELGADPNGVDSYGNTAFHNATGSALAGMPQEIVMEVCCQLHKLGVPLNTRNQGNQTPLLRALSGNTLAQSQKDWLSALKTVKEVCRFLLKHGSSIEERSQNGESVFHLILQLYEFILQLPDVREVPIELLQLFSPEKVAKTGIVNIPRKHDLNSPLHLWASLELPSLQEYTSNVTKDLEFQEFLQKVLNYLLKCGAKLNARNDDDRTPLHLCRTWIAAKQLLDAGAKANDVDSSGASPLLAAAKRNSTLYPDIAELKDPKSFWKTAIDKGLDPWTADKEGESVLSVLVRYHDFLFAKALVDLAHEQNLTQSETFAVGLLNAICKDKSTQTKWKSNLVNDILKSRRGPITASEPLRLCCKNIVETGALDNKVQGKSASGAIDSELPAEEDDEEDIAKYLSVHCEMIKILRLCGADGKSCLDIADTSDALKDLLTKPLDFSTMSVLVPWTSVSKKYEGKLVKVARRQDCQVIHEEFWYHKEYIGSGSYGHVFVGINEKDGREVAIKRIVKLRMQRPEDKREIRNLTSLADCKQIVRYLHFFEDDNFSYIVLELMEGTLDEYFADGPIFDVSRSTQLCQDVVQGLKFLHAQNIIHRDLKPGNILYKTHPHLCLKLADFGLSRHLDISATTVYGTNAGTRCWMAPELLLVAQVKGGDHSKVSDMFSCGLVLHYILSVQKHPFSKNNSQVPHEIEANIANGRMEGWDDSLSPEATHLIKNILQADDKDRLTGEKGLEHPFFWSKEKKVDLLIAVGNQTVFEYPRAGRSTCLSAVETDLEKNFGTIVVHGKWDVPVYKDMPLIFKEMTSSKRKFYDTQSVVELVRFIRNAYAHVSEATRPTALRKMLLEDFVFLEYFPHLVMEVYKVVTDHGWDQTVEEIKYAMNK